VNANSHNTFQKTVYFLAITIEEDEEEDSMDESISNNAASFLTLSCEAFDRLEALAVAEFMSVLWNSRSFSCWPVWVISMPPSRSKLRDCDEGVCHGGLLDLNFSNIALISRILSPFGVVLYEEGVDSSTWS
jgi:hypothetical protein